MITSSSISYITQMLEEPQNITEADKESIEELTKSFPYFVPVRYMQAAQQHKDEAFVPDMLTTMQLFSGNWYLYNEYLQAALGGEDVAFGATTIEPAKPQTEEEVLAEEEVATAIAPEEETAHEEIREEPAAIEEPETAEEEPTEIEKEQVNTGFIRGRQKDSEPIAAVATEAETQPVEATEEITDTEKEPEADKEDNWKNENLIPPVYAEDYFLHQGVHVSNELPDDIGDPESKLNVSEGEQSLMVVMSFSEWLVYYKKKKQQEQEEEEDQRALKSMWQKEKLAAALEEENEEIPENVFEMAVNSITKEESLASEALAEVLVKQGRYDRAIDMYKKLSLRKPQKKAYFARKIEDILKEK